MIKKQHNISWYVGLICTALVLGGYCITIGFQGMPPAEGWYTWYAKLINDGAMVYKDFSYLFFPFYIQFIAAFCNIFGYSIFALRVLGLLTFVAIGSVAYLIFSRLATPPAATIAAIATTMYLQSEVVQIFYDYIRFMDLFAYLTIYFLIRIMQTLPEKSNNRVCRANYDSLFLGLFATLTCMTKQSTGTLIIVYIVILFLFLALVLDRTRTKYLLTCLGQYIVVVVALFCVMAIWLIVNNAGKAFLINATGNALDAKGGLFTVLFSWIIILFPSMLEQLISVIGILAIAVFLLVCSYTKFQCANPQHFTEWTIKINTRYKAAGQIENFVLAVFSAGVSGLCIVLCRRDYDFAVKFSDRFFSSFMILGFVLCTLCFAFLGFFFLYHAISHGKLSKTKGSDEHLLFLLPWFALLGSIFAIAYGVGMSASLCESQTALSIGFLLILLSKGLEHFHFRIAGMVFLILFGAFFSTTCAARKYLNIYSWWGLTEGTIWDAYEKADVPLLERIRMNTNEKKMYEGVVEIVTEYTNEDDTIFCFPHIPIFYSLTDRSSNTYTQVQWFDMSNIKDIEQDIQTLRSNLPKAIVYCSLPESTYVGHENRFNAGMVSQTRIMSDFLMQLVANNNYSLMGEYPICEGYAVSVYINQSDNQTDITLMQERKAIQDTTQILSDYINADDAISIFSHTPILNENLSNTYSNIQEFDIADVAQLERDLQTFAADLPKAIIYCISPEDSSEYEYIPGEISETDGSLSQPDSTNELLNKFIFKNRYTIRGSFPVGDDYRVLLYLNLQE